MSGVVAKLTNPAFYRTSWAGLTQKAQAYYHPLIRQNSATPLWHAMLGISAIMYTSTYVARVYPEVQARRAKERQAMAEYYEKHGGGDHH